MFRGARERTQYQTRLRDSAYRERVVFEILTTEQTYVDSLAGEHVTLRVSVHG